MFIGILSPFKVGIKWAEVWRQLEHSVMHRPVEGPAHQYDYTIIYSTSLRNTQENKRNMIETNLHFQLLQKFRIDALLFVVCLFLNDYLYLTGRACS